MQLLWPIEDVMRIMEMITCEGSKLSFSSGNIVSPSGEFPLLAHGSVFGKCNLLDGSGNE